MPTPKESKAEMAIRRARSMLGVHMPYILGGGGRSPAAATPATTVYRAGKRIGRGSDCMGFVAWCCGFDRFQHDFPFYGGWINCDSMLGAWKNETWHPAEGFFELLSRPEPGCLVVYPSIDIDHDGKRDRIGHVALVESCTEGMWSWQTTQVIHCASTASRDTGGKSVAQTDATLWGRAGTYRGSAKGRWKAAFLRPLL